MDKQLFHKKRLSIQIAAPPGEQMRMSTDNPTGCTFHRKERRLWTNMAKRKLKYSRRLAAILAASMVAPQVTPASAVMVAFAAEGADSTDAVSGQKQPANETATSSDAEIDAGNTAVGGNNGGEGNAGTSAEEIEITASNNTSAAGTKNTPPTATTAAPKAVPLAMTAEAVLDLKFELKGDTSKEWDGTDAYTGGYSIGYSGLIAGHTDISIDKDAISIRYEDSEVGDGKDVIIENISLTGADADYYTTENTVRIEADAKIVKRTLRLTGGTVVNRGYAPGDTSANVSFKVENIAPADYDYGTGSIVDGNLDIEVAAYFEDDSVGTDKPVTVDHVAINGAHASNYVCDASALDGLTGTITKEYQNVPDIKYDGNGNITGTDSSMEYRLNEGAWVSCDGSGAVSLGETGTYEFRYKETENYFAGAVYKFTYGSGVTDPSEFYIRFTEAYSPEKEYDGTDAAPISLEFGGIMQGDSVEIESYNARYESADVGEGIKVIVSDFVLSGEDAAKYQPYAGSIVLETTGKITPRVIDVHVAANNKEYDGSNTANVYISRQTSFVNGEDAAIELSGHFESADAGTGIAVAIDNIGISGADAGNYILGTVKYGRYDAENGSFEEFNTLTADIEKARQDAPEKSLFAVSDSKITGYTDTMEVLLPGETQYKDCSQFPDGIQAESGNAYVFRYKEDDNHLPGATMTLNISVVKTVTITFDIGEEMVTGTVPTSATVTTGQAYGNSVLVDITPADPDREFLGWYTDPAAGERVYPDTVCDKASDFILYARFGDKIHDRKDGHISVTMAGYTYGEGASTPSTDVWDGDYSKVTYYFKEKSAGDGAYTTDVPKYPGDYTVKAVAEKTDAYNQAEASCDFSVAKRRITVIPAANSRTYNGSTACGGKVSVTGSTIQGDEVSINSSALAFSFADKNVAENKEVTVSGITLEGNDAGYYELVIEKAYADITPYVLTYKEEPLQDNEGHAFTITARTKSYDGTTNVVLDTVMSTFAGDNVSVTAEGAFDSADVAAGGENENTVTVVSAKLTGSDAGNYQIDSSSALFPLTIPGTILKAQNTSYPDISGTNPTLGLSNGRITGVDSSMEYSADGTNWADCPDGEINGLPVGEYWVRYKETGNFRASGTSIITLIDRTAAETVKITFYSDGNAIGTSTVSKGSSPKNAPEITKDGYTLAGWQTASGDTFVFGETQVNANMNLYAVWELIPVQKENGQIRVSMEDGVYGDVLVLPSCETVKGDYLPSEIRFFYKGENDSAFTDEKPVLPGIYTVKAVAAETGAYTAAEDYATFTITKRELSFTVSADTREYDGTTDVSGYSFRFGNVLEEDDGLVNVDKSSASVRFLDKDAGENKMVEATGFALTGEKASCYRLPDILTGTGIITPKEITLTIQGIDKDYDGTTAANVTIRSDGIIEGDEVSYSYAAYFEGSEPGVGKRINVSSIRVTGADGGNYVPSSETGTASADIRSLSTEKKDGKIEVTMADSVYGDALGTPTARNVSGDYSISSGITFLYKEDGAGDETYSSEKPSLPGTYRVKAVASPTEYFNSTSAETVFTISPRTITMSVTADEKVYDGTTLVYSWRYEYGNVLEEDKENLTIDKSGAGVYFSDKNAGENKPLSISGFKLGGNAADFYQLPDSIAGTGTITPKTLTLSFEGVDKKYDGTTTAEVSITSGGVVENDSVSFTYEAAFEDAGEGVDKAIRVSDITLSGKDASNYRLAKTSGTASADITRNDELQYSYEIRYVNGAGKVLDTKSGMAADGGTVNTSGVKINGYDVPNQVFTVDRDDDDANVFYVTCVPASYTLTILKEVDGVRSFLREVGYTIENTVRVNGNAAEHEDFVGYTGDWFDGLRNAVNLNTWTVVLPVNFTGDHTAVLVFKKETPAICFDANGGILPDGVNAMDDIYAEEVKAGDTLAACTFVRAGYSFAGWATRPDGIAVYADGALVSDIPYSEDNSITLYAVWEANENTIRFDLNGGASLVEIPRSITVRTGESYPALPAAVSADAENPFIGWYTESGIRVREGDICDGLVDVLYAHYGMRHEGKVELSVRGWEYGSAPDVSVRLVSGDYDMEDGISYSFRSTSGSGWTEGLPVDPGEYVIRVTAAETENTLGTTAQANVTIGKRALTADVGGLWKVYDGTADAPVVITLNNTVTGDDVSAVAAETEYESAMPGSHKVHIRSITLTGTDAWKYTLAEKSMTLDGIIDKMPGEAVDAAVAAVNETIYGKEDGRITGVTSAMEWREEGTDAAWMTCPDGELSGLANGTYEIRMKETDLSYAGPVSNLAVNSDRILNMTVVNADGTSTVIGVPYGSRVEKPAAPVRSGYRFDGWYKDEALTRKWDFDNGSDPDNTVTGDVKLYPKWTRVSSGSGSSGGGGGGSSSGGSGKSSGGSIGYGPGTGSVSGEWSCDTEGNWRFNAGRLYANEWAYVHNPYADSSKGQSANDWFHFGEDGVMDTGWFTDTDGRVYYLNPVSDNTMGRMFTGWQWIRGADGLRRCYYFEEVSNGYRGSLYRQTTTPDGYTVDADGAWIMNGEVVTLE